ncbi:MAG TPA: TIR domain-containing protein [Opitutaceae bacterium]|nr:TIR domain-containing protein [Opitutaceae bacterium]
MPASSPSAANRAVFLSYAREDTAAASRIAEALRSHGVEVWFDQSELRGGDAWDQKIRRQIDACTLFIPIISRNTEERGKGYFRLEWKLAVEQTHLLMEGVPFLVPVVVDDTPDSAAACPVEFRRVQWTRLPGALPSPQFVEHVKRLLEGPRAPSAAGRGDAVQPGPMAPASGPRARTWWLAVGLVAAAAAIGWLVLRPAPPGIANEAGPAPPVAAPVNDKSIAVLPFENMSEEKDSSFFTDGIHEDILTNLALVRDLHVVSRTSVMQYRGTTKTIGRIGSELHVAYVLEGSVRRAGGKVRVTGQLINARTDEHVWAKAYDRDATDIFGIQSELSQEIAGALAAALSPQEKTLLERRPTDNLAAYEVFLKGRDVFNRAPAGTPVALRQAEQFYRQAVDADPNFATAWGSLAEIDALFVFWEIDHTAARLAKADAAMGNAVRIAPDAPDVIRALGTYAYYAYRDYARASEQYEKLARLQPNDPTVSSSLGLILRRQGRWAESLVQLRRAVELDPGNISFVRNLLQSMDYARRWDEAIALQRRLVAMLPEQHVREEISLSWLCIYATGSTKEADALLARLTPEELNSHRVITWRRNLAAWKDDYAEFKRLDALQPFFDEDGGEHAFQALNAAEVYAAHGDLPAARARLADFPSDLRARIEREPANSRLYGVLGEMEALLGHNEEAVRLARRGVELLPETRDTIDAPNLSYYLAEVYAWTGDKDRALDELARLLSIPSRADIHSLRRDPMLTALKGDPRFEAQLEDPRNTAQLF